MTARLSLVLVKPEKSLSTSLLAFSLINRPSLVKKPVWPAEHLNREGGAPAYGSGEDGFRGNLKTGGVPREWFLRGGERNEREGRREEAICETLEALSVLCNWSNKQRGRLLDNM